MEDFDKKWEELVERNNEFLKIFEDDLDKAGLADKTIDKHYGNVRFYLNEFLPRANLIPMEKGMYSVNEYFGYFFIHKCLWSTPATIKSTAASIKKFYKCMLEHEKITQKNYDDLCACIKENMEDWQNECEDYNNPNNWYEPF